MVDYTSRLSAHPQVSSLIPFVKSSPKYLAWIIAVLTKLEKNSKFNDNEYNLLSSMDELKSDGIMLLNDGFQ